MTGTEYNEGLIRIMKECLSYDGDSFQFWSVKVPVLTALKDYSKEIRTNIGESLTDFVKWIVEEKEYHLLLVNSKSILMVFILTITYVGRKYPEDRIVDMKSFVTFIHNLLSDNIERYENIERKNPSCYIGDVMFDDCVETIDIVLGKKK